MTIGEKRYEQEKLLITPMIYCEENQEVLKLLEKEGLSYQCNEYGRKYEEEELIESLQDCEALICEREILSRKVMEACPHLELISVLGTDSSFIDLQAAKDHEITVCKSSKADIQALADLNFAMLLYLARNFSHKKTKPSNSKPGKDVWGQTLGLIGFGPVAQAMAERAWGFNMDVLYCDPYYERSYPFSEEVSLDVLLKRSDFISLHADFNPETFQMIDHEAFNKMKRKVIILNTSHSEMIHYPALYHALDTKEIFGAAVHEEMFKGVLGEKLEGMDHVISYCDQDVETESSKEKHALEAIRNVLEKLERE